jgi:hypothetical protein
LGKGLILGNFHPVQKAAILCRCQEFSNRTNLIGETRFHGGRNGQGDDMSTFSEFKLRFNLPNDFGKSFQVKKGEKWAALAAGDAGTARQQPPTITS